jgi:hypothetical protein
MRNIQIKRGIKANLPALSVGEFAFCTDTKELFIGSATGNIKVHPTDGSGEATPQYIVKDSWSASGTHTLSEIMNGFNVYNSGNANLTVTINGISFVVKSKEKFEDIFDPFSQVTISATDTFYATASALESGSTNPKYSVKESFSGSSSITHNLTGAMRDFVISNDGSNSLTYIINGLTIPVLQNESDERSFDSFNQVSISATSAFRAYTRGTFASDTIAPVVTASPNGGTFNATQSLTLSTNEMSTIYYTLDGSTPTQSSTIYSTPISITTTTTVKYFAKDITGNISTIESKTFTLDTTAPIVTASVLDGTYTSTQTVTLTADEAATIYYTLDGSTPTTSSNVYSSALSISATTTLKYFGKDTAGNTSVVQTQTYTITAPDTTAPTVTISPVAGTYNATQSVTLSANETATIYYTLDGSTPTTSSTVYSTPISVSSTTTIKYFGVDSSLNASDVQTTIYTIDTVVPNPVTALTAGAPTANTIPVSWTLSDSNDVANQEVAYSTDGTNYIVASAVVNSSSTSYTVTGLSANTNYTIRVITIDGAGNSSSAVTTNATTTANVSSGYYYMNGSNSTLKTGSIAFDEIVVEFAAKFTIGFWQAIIDTRDGATYTTGRVVRKPSFGYDFFDSPFTSVTIDGGANVTNNVNFIPYGQKTILRAKTASAITRVISFFANNDSTDKTMSNVYDIKILSGGTVVAHYDFTQQASGTTVLDLSGNNNTATITNGVWVASDVTAPTVALTVPTGSYDQTQNVYLVPSEPSKVYYTMDGSVPTTSSTKWEAITAVPITNNGVTVVKAFAVDIAGNAGPVATYTYTLPSTPPPEVTGLTSSASGTTATLSWVASAGASRYEVYDGSTLVAMTKGTSCDIINLQPSTQYTFNVKALDKVMNISAGVPSTTFTTETAPAIVSTGYVASGLTHFFENIVTNSKAVGIFNTNNLLMNSDHITICMTYVGTPTATLVLRAQDPLVTGWKTRNADSRFDIANTANNQAAISYHASNGTITSVNTAVMSDISTVQHHIAFTKGAVYTDSYQDNTRNSHTTGGGAVVRNSNLLPVIIGENGKSFTIKSIAIYNRELTPAELTQNYNALK